jgi:hypothetical protein
MHPCIVLAGISHGLCRVDEVEREHIVSHQRTNCPAYVSPRAQGRNVPLPSDKAALMAHLLPLLLSTTYRNEPRQYDGEASCAQP